MDQPVNGISLKKAVEQSSLEYPFLKLGIERRADGLFWVPNDAPIAVLNTSDDVDVPSELTNGQHVVLLWHDNVIAFKFSHALMDGRGSSPFFGSVLSHYFGLHRERHISPLETVDMLGADNGNWHFSGLEGYTPACREAYSLTEDGNIEETESFNCRCIVLDEKEFMTRCKSSDGTPNVAMSVLICRAVRSYQEQSVTSGKLPVINISADMRSCLGNTLTHWHSVADMHLPFDERMEGRDFMTQCTMMRGRLFLESDADTLRLQASRIHDTISKSLSLQTIEEKDAFYCKQHERTHAHSTALVSYVGEFPFGDEVNRHILKSQVFLSAVWAMLQIEITVSSGHFYLTWMQKFKEDVLLNLFLDELRQLGLDFELC